MILTILLSRSSNPTGLLIWCGVGLCAGIYLFIHGFRLLQRRHLILNTPVSKVRSASLGMVELNGLAVGPYTMLAPITARPCYYYRTLVWEWKQSGKNKQWVQVAAECMHVPFFLDDNTGKVMVDPRGADLDLHRDFQQEFCDSFFTTKEEAPDNVRGFLSRYGISTTNKIKVEEFCIKPKNSLFLLGTLSENPGLELTPQPVQDQVSVPLYGGDGFKFAIGGNALSLFEGGSGGNASITIVENAPLGDQRIGAHTLRELGFDKSALYREGFRRLTHMSEQVIQLSPDSTPTKATEMTQQEKIAAALLKAGISSPAAWASAGVMDSPISGARSNSSAGTQNSRPPSTDGFDLHPPVVLMKGSNDPTFMISWRSQRDVARSLGWKCTLMIWGGPALALISFYVLGALTHWF